MKRIIILLLVFTTANQIVFSQSNKKTYSDEVICSNIAEHSVKSIFYSEHGEEIPCVKYRKSIKSVILTGYDIVVDKNSNIRRYGIYFSHDFGTIQPSYLKQIKKQLSKSSGKKILSNQTIVIRYNNNLYKKDKVIKRLTSGPVHKSKATAKNKIKKWRVDIKKGLKSLEERKDSKLFFVYANNLGGKHDYPKLKLNWIEDTMNLGDSLFKIKHTHHLIVIRPNGEYFISNVHLSSHLIKKILDEEDWSQFRKDWKKSYQKMSPRGYGVFRTKKQAHNILCHS